MDPDKTRKIVAVTVFLPLFITGIGLILGLSEWWITATVIIIPASILVAWLKPSFLQFQQPNQNQPSWPSRLLGWAKKDPLSAFVFSIALLVIVYGVFSYWQNNSPDEVYTFTSQQEFQKNWQVVSGSWQVKNNGYLEGFGEIKTKNGGDISIKGLQVIPAETELKELNIFISPSFLVKNWQGGPREGYSFYGKDMVFYRSSVFYKGREVTYVGNERVKSSNVPLPILVAKDAFGTDPKVYIGGKFLVSSFIDEPSSQKVMQNKISLIAVSTVQIKEVQIFYG